MPVFHSSVVYTCLLGLIANKFLLVIVVQWSWLRVFAWKIEKMNHFVFLILFLILLWAYAAIVCRICSYWCAYFNASDTILFSCFCEFLYIPCWPRIFVVRIFNLENTCVLLLARACSPITVFVFYASRALRTSVLFAGVSRC